MSDVLYDMPVILLDCQATAAWSAGGRLLEIGWAKYRACDDPGCIEVRHWLVSDEVEPLPRRIKRLTGLDDDDFTDTMAPGTVWKTLMREAEDIRMESGLEHCPVVIHYAAFERPFLLSLHDTDGPGGPFPLTIHCTHALARRLYPELPRRSLRALAGYLGYSVPEERRCLHHVLATACIWHHIVAELNERYGITHLGEYNAWMEETKSRPAATFIPLLDRDIRLSIPDTPGVYRMCRSNGDVIYVGKATSLRRRVNSYFHRGARHPGHILEMLTQVRNIEATSTATSLEAALLESDEIKRLSPPYNVQLRTGDREVVFLSRDLTNAAPGPDNDHTLGPIVGGQLIDRMKACAMILGDSTGNTLVDTVTTMMFGAGEYGDMPPPEIIDDGIGVFRDRYKDITGSNDVYARFIRIGKTLHAGVLDMSGIEENDDFGEAEADTSEAEIWTPDRVARRIEGVIRQGAYSLRRARWFLRLSESIITWNQPNHNTDSDTYALVMSGSSVVWAGWLESTQDVPVNPDFSSSMLKRLFAFGIVEYDRMRVLTTELRRLVSEGRGLRLRMGSCTNMSTVVLARVLRWV